jgi:prolyl 4-hydroxylase
MHREELDGERVFLIHDFLSSGECAEFIRRAEGQTWESGTVGQDVVSEVRNNDRILLDDPSLAAELFQRARPWLPAEQEGKSLVGFNERWRYYRYRPGQTFKPHRDGSYQRLETGDSSRLTFMIYLNDALAGGRTRFFASMQEAFLGCPYLEVRPQTGTALVFVHRIWHEGEVVESGQKYVLRTDIMYGFGS